MADTFGLGDRMKAYEAVPSQRLIRRLPVILRLDGRAFHTLTRGMDRPIDWRFIECMATAAISLCQEAANAQVAFVQSDEISLLLTDHKTLRTQPWFDNRVQKLCSVAASITTAAFNVAFAAEFPRDTRLGTFDCRAFNLPKEEVVNYFLWRQRDATRNSILSLAQAHFSHRQLLRKDLDQLQELLFRERGINWNDCPPLQKRGFCVLPMEVERATPEGAQVRRREWGVDKNTPVFSQDRGYLQRFVDVEEGEEGVL